MSPRGTKIFRDAVHNYIHVPRDICAAFIDTPIFQRLRHIEQTSMRPLYPSAHHDRFAHSLGVYHLASTAFSHICENTDTTLLPGIKLSDYTRPFEIGALMHDCGHSPFSHLFEVHYNRNGRALAFLNEQVSERFKKDYESRLEATEKRVEPAPHEVFSAAIFLKHYGQKYRDLLPGRDPELIARMITGTTYARPENIGEQCENCLVMLINGGAIDVDKLDYIIRDSWASGVNNISIDTTRLLSAMQIVKYDMSLVPGFKKSALSVIQNVVDARNYLYKVDLFSPHSPVSPRFTERCACKGLPSY